MMPSMNTPASLKVFAIGKRKISLSFSDWILLFEDPSSSQDALRKQT
jgi:hypothetical protein